jgi:hypothetical protein
MNKNYAVIPGKLGLVVLLVILCFSLNPARAITYQIGTGTTTNTLRPIYSCYGFNYNQQIYTAAELNAAGAVGSQTITHIRFFYASGGTTVSAWNNWTVYIGNTAQATLASSTNWVPLANMTQVFSGTFTPVAGTWVTLTLSTPFVWNGTSNLVVAVDENAASFSCTAAWRSYTSTSGNRSMGYYSDVTNPSPSAPPTANTLPSTVMPQIQFEMTAAAACAGTPLGGTSAISLASGCAGTTFSLSNTGASSGGGISYQWQSAPAAGGPWNNIGGATSTTFNTSAAATTFYRLLTTCSSSGISTASNEVSYTVAGTACNYTFRLTDSYGDGWNGASMQVRIGTTVVATLGSTFTTGTQLDVPVSLCGGTTYNLFYLAGGSYASEVGIQILDNTNTVIYTLGAGAGIVGSILHSWTASCPLPPAISSFSPTTACGASTSVTISGSGFTGATAVSFGGVAAQSFTVVNATTITAIPAAAGASGNVSVTGPAGSASLAGFTHLTAPSVSISALPASAVICGAGSVQLTASGSGSGYTWSPGGLSGAVQTVSPGSTTVYTVTSTNGTCTNTATQLVTVSPLPVITSLVSTPSTLCYGANATLSATPALPVAICTPTVSSAGASGDFISNVNFNGGAINNSSGDALNDYTDYPVPVANVTAGLTYPVSVTTGPTYAQGKGIFIDYNKNGSFADAGEFVWSAPSAVGIASGSFTIPANATSGVVRMRVVCYYFAQPTASNSCNIPGFGEYEDYRLNISGGTGAQPITSYTWSPATFLSTISGAQTTATAATATTVYTVLASDANGCSSTSSLTMTVNPALSGSASVTSNYNGVPISCFGSADGIITVNAAGGTPGYTYSLNGGAFGPNNVFSGLPAGTYSITVRDALLCTIALTPVTLTSPALLSLSGSATPVTCFGQNGSIGFAASGGTGTLNLTVNGTAAVSPASLPAGTYTIVATDANACSVSMVQTITQPPALVLSASASNPLCNGANGSIGFGASGGTGLITYSVNGTAATSPLSQPAGTYTIVATDANNCSTSSVLSITQPTAIVLTASSTDPLCNGDNGSIIFSATGGTGTLSYALNGASASSPASLPAGTYTLVVTDANNCSASSVLTITQPPALLLTASAANPLCNGNNGTLTFSATGGTGAINYTVNGTADASPSSRPPGTYTIVATDANNCSVSSVFTITQPALLVLTATATNALCNGINGSLGFSATGGSGTIVYTVNGTPSTSPDPRPAGTYTIVATDANGCSASEVRIITEPTAIVLNTSVTNALCTGTNGSLIFSAAGGTGTINFTVNGTTATSPASRPAGTYTIVAVDANNCTVSSVQTITEPALALGLTSSATDALCNGLNGSLTFSATGGTGVVTFTVNGAPEVSPASRPAGTYTVVATDANGCSLSAVHSINQPAAVSLTASGTPPSCNGGLGSLSFTATGGTGSMAYTINGTAASSPASLPAGTYTIVATDVNACSSLTVITVTQPATLLISNATPANVSCNNGNDGLIAVTTTGGTPAVSFAISPATGAQVVPGIFSSLTAQGYTITATDMNGCISTTAVNITQPTAVGITSVNTTNITCNGGNNGQAVVIANGGTGIITYSISPNVGVQSPAGTFTNLTAQAYTITATDVNGCTSTSALSLTQPGPISVVITNSTLPSCTPGCDGTISVIGSGGAGPITYSIIPSAGINQPTSGSFSALCAGTNYVITASFGNGCTATTSTTLSNPNAPVISITSSANLLCSGLCNATAQATTLPGVTYSIGGPGAPLVNASGSATNLCAGVYFISATDANTCVGTTSVTITEPLPVNLTASSTNAQCNGASGSLNFSAAGGTGSITYTVNGIVATSPAARPAGTYTIVATDANNCTASTVMSISQPSAIVLTASSTNAQCYGANGSLIFNAAGGSGAIIYTVNGLLATSPASRPAGTYTIVATDANSCSVSVVRTITQPGSIVLTASAANALCNGTNGSLSFSATGGTGTKTFTVNGLAATTPASRPAGTYTIVATDANGCSVSAVRTITEPASLLMTASASNPACNGINGTLNFSASGGTGSVSYTVNGAAASSPAARPAGTYTVVASDIYGCTTSSILTITQPAVVTLTASATNALCNGGSGTLNFSATGGSGTMTYTVNGTIATSPAPRPAGSYTIVATDANGCSASAVRTITQPSAIALTASSANALCNGTNGSLSFNASGGTGAMVYTVNGITATSPASRPAGTYTIVATDANGCTISAVRTITQPSVIALTAASSNALCNGINGSLTFSATGGTGTLAFTVNGISAASPASRPAGTYTIVATDANGCSASSVLIITQPAAIILTALSTNATCNGTNGNLNFTATGGTGAITFSVNGTPAVSPASHPAGTYTIVATDAIGCSASAVRTITQPSALTLTASSANAFCNGNNGSLIFSATGGAGSITYTVNGLIAISPASRPAGTYTIVATDANSCTASAVRTITQPVAINLTASVTSPACNGGLGSLLFSATGGVGTVNYSVNGTAATSPAARPAGTYTVVVTDANGCTVSSVLTITQPAPVTLTATAVNALCNGINGSLNFGATGGTAPVTFTVNGVAASSPSSYPVGTYTIVATDANGCSASAIQTIMQPSVISLNVVATDALCNGANGSLSYSATGGTGIMTYTVNGTVSASPSLHPAGTYTVVAADANGCTASGTSSIFQPTPISWANAVTAPLCNGGLGSLAFSATGGTGIFTYTVNGLSATSPASYPAGTYTIAASDANNCNSSTVMILSEPSPLSLIVSSTSAICNGSTGSLTFSATGGSGTIAYTVNGTAASSPASYPAGSYTIVATDANNCSASTVQIITEPAAIMFTVSAANPLCNGTNGSLTFSATGGTGTLLYTVNGTAASSPASYPAGSYTIVATDANNCSASTVQVITQPSAISLTASATNALCNGSNGSLAFNAAGGTGTMLYTVNGAAASSPASYPAGSYTIVATDANNCSASTVQVITQPSAISLTASATNALCNGSNGSLTFSATGGTGTISYTVNGTGAISPLVAAAGSYTIVATDANNCQTSVVQAVVQPTSVTIGGVVKTLYNGANLSCISSSNGQFTVNAIGGSGPLQYSANNGVTFQPGNTFSNLGAGSYTVVVKDANNCSASSVVSLAAPPALVISASGFAPACNGGNGQIQFAALGGTGSLTYQVNGIAQVSPLSAPAGSYTITVQDANNCSASSVVGVSQPAVLVLSASSSDPLCNGGNGQLTFSASGGSGTPTYLVNGTPQVSPYAAPAGTYTVVVADANACTTSSVLTISSPALLQLNASSSTILCNGANSDITATASGGTGALSYSLNGGLPQASGVFVGNPAGSYTVSVTDANNCSSQIVLNIVQPTALTLSANATPPVCTGNSGALDFVASGGTGGYTYTVNGVPSVSPMSALPGTYTIVATDANACSQSTVLTMGSPVPVTVTATSTAGAICLGNSVTFTAVGNGVTYAWSDGVNTPSDGVPFTPPAVGTSVYTVTATSGACTSTATISLTVHGVGSFTSPVTLTTACPSAPGSSITIGSTGTTGTVTYGILPAHGTQPVPGIFNGLIGGATYTVSLVDANGCTASTVVNAAQAPTNGTLANALALNAASAPGNSCKGQNQPDGSLLSFYGATCEQLIVSVQDAPGGNALGNVNACVTVTPAVQTYNGQPYLRRSFDILPQNQGPALITFYFTHEDITGFNANAGSYPQILNVPAVPTNGNTISFLCSQVPQGFLPGAPGGSTTLHSISATWNAAANRWETTITVNSFSGFYFHTGSVPLPVAMTSFEGQKQSGGNLLQWITASEQNNDRFVLQHSTDARSYRDLTEVASLAPGGNSSQPLSYSFLHTAPELGHNYYRLQQVDLDGQTSMHAKVVDLIWTALGSTVTLHPNPARDVLYVDLYTARAEELTVKLIDLSGRTVQTVKARTNGGQTSLSMQLGDLAAGVYTVQVSENNQVSFTGKVDVIR